MSKSEADAFERDLPLGEHQASWVVAAIAPAPIRFTEGPTVEAAAAAMLATDLFARKMHPRKPRPARELARMLDELIEAAIRLRSVTHTEPRGDAVESEAVQ